MLLDFPKIAPQRTQDGLRLFFVNDQVKYNGVAVRVVKGLNPDIAIASVPDVYFLNIMPESSSDNIGCGAGCGACVSSNDADLVR